jgi:aminoglycoside phosphotransferase family enzyme/predicted kinase
MPLRYRYNCWHPESVQETRAEVRETHSSVVLLLGGRAYKFKKAVDLGFLDFRRLEDRARACRREVDLNRRIAPDVYLSTIALKAPDDTTYEHGIAMRRMPEELRLATMIQHGDLVDEQLCALARLLADFHARAARAPLIAAEGGAAGLRRRWVDNLREAEAFRGGTLPDGTFDLIRRLALDYVDGRVELLKERADAGLSVDGHGDLLADDIFCLPDGPRVLDCLDFDDRLRWVDMLDDAAFLAMDLERLGREDLADTFMRRYTEFSGIPVVESLRHHYIAYRAFVRAKVTAIQAQQGDRSAAAQSRRCTELSARHLRAGEVRFILIGGAPGTGKTTIATALAARLGYVLVGTDSIRQESPLASDYSATAKAAIYRMLLERARTALAHGESVVADATWTDQTTRDLAVRVSAETSSPLVAFECQAPTDLAARRAQLRWQAGGSTSAAGARVAAMLAAARVSWPEAIALDTTGGPDQPLRAALDALHPHVDQHLPEVVPA